MASFFNLIFSTILLWRIFFKHKHLDGLTSTMLWVWLLSSQQISSNNIIKQLSIFFAILQVPCTLSCILLITTNLQQYKSYNRLQIPYYHTFITQWYLSSYIQLKTELHSHLYNKIGIHCSWFNNQGYYLALMFVYKFMFLTYSSNKTFLWQLKHDMISA